MQKAEKEGSPNLDSLKKALANIESKTEDIKKQWSEFEKKEKVSNMKLASLRICTFLDMNAKR